MVSESTTAMMNTTTITFRRFEVTMFSTTTRKNQSMPKHLSVKSNKHNI